MAHRKLWRKMVFFVVWLALMSSACGPRAAGWRIQVVDRAVRSGETTSLALDSEGRPHIAYCDGAVKYAQYDGQRWHTEVVEDGFNHFWPALVLDALGFPHLVYSFHSELRYAYWDGSRWHANTVTSCRGHCQGDSLVIDRQGVPHISYIDSNKPDSRSAGDDYLKYAKYDGQQWAIETVDSSGSKWHFWMRMESSSLALDSAGLPHIAYFAETPHDVGLRYAHRTDQGWAIEVVSSEEGTDGFASLALDHQDHPHIAYQTFSYRMYNQDLVYFHHDGTSWQKEVVDTGLISLGDGGGVSNFCSLALDSADQPHVGYYYEPLGNIIDLIRGTRPPSELKYAYSDGETWHTETVDSRGDSGYCVSLALGMDNRPHISYYDWAGASIKYAVYEGTRP